MGVRTLRYTTYTGRPNTFHCIRMLHALAYTLMYQAPSVRCLLQFRQISDSQVLDPVHDLGFFGVIEAIQCSHQITGNPAYTLKFYALSYQALMIWMKSATVHIDTPARRRSCYFSG